MASRTSWSRLEKARRERHLKERSQEVKRIVLQPDRLLWTLSTILGHGFDSTYVNYAKRPSFTT